MVWQPVPAAVLLDQSVVVEFPEHGHDRLIADAKLFGHLLAGVDDVNLLTAWFMWVVVRHILGLQPSGDGIKINLCLPDGFENVSVSIDGKRYLIAKKR